MPNKASRIRDPERRERILAAAAELIARRGYLGVNLSDIGAAAGIVGSGVYRHFDTKVAILVELFDRVVDRLVDDAEAMLRTAERPEIALSWLVHGQVEFALSQRTLCQVYLQESRNLPENDLRRLRWKQRHYVDLWLDLMRSVHPELPSGEAEVRVHAAISAVQSVLDYRAHLDDPTLARQLQTVACHILEIAVAPGGRRPASDPAPDAIDVRATEAS